MQLKFNKSMHKRIIMIELETVNFTPKENELLDKFGEPNIVINKKYQSIFPVSIDRFIRTGFKVRVKFDGKENDLSKAALAAEDFYDEIKEKLTAAMEDLTAKEFEILYENNRGFETIKYS